MLHVLPWLRRLSASAVQVTEMEAADHHLSRQLRHHSMSACLDTHTLRIRKMSLDNRYIATPFSTVKLYYQRIFITFRWVQ